jgi:hypothetical protein
MGGHEARDYWEHAGLTMLVAGVLLGPLAWLLDLQVSYALVKWACRADARSVLGVTAAGSLTLVTAGAWLSWRCWRRLRAEASPEGGGLVDRSYFLALAGLGLNGLFALLVFASLVPRYVLSPCE